MFKNDVEMPGLHSGLKDIRQSRHFDIVLEHETRFG